ARSDEAGTVPPDWPATRVRALLRGRAHGGQRGVVEQAIAGEDRAAVDAVGAVEIGESATRLLHDDLERGDVPRLDGGRERDLSLALGHPEVRGEVAEAALHLCPIGQMEEALPVSAP